jgi:hypothetical protein
MADFTAASADARAVAKVADKTWVVAHSCRATTGGKIAVRLIRPMTAAFTQGGWVEVTDDGTT